MSAFRELFEQHLYQLFHLDDLFKYFTTLKLESFQKQATGTKSCC